MEKVRVIRVLEYVGPRSWVESTLENNAVKGIKVLGNGATIREAILGDFPEIVEEEKPVLESHTLSEQIGMFMTRFGWEFPADGPAIKYETITGKVLAHEGDETWTRDLKVAGE